MKHMVCLLSDQLAPNILSVHHFKPDSLVLVETERMRKTNVAANLLATLAKGGLDYANATTRLLLQEEDSLPAMRSCFAPLLGKNTPEDTWLINLTGGTKPMSLGTYAFFKENSLSKSSTPLFLYMNIGKPDHFTLLDRGDHIPCHYELSIEEFLRAYGFALIPNPVEEGKKEIMARLWEPSRRIAHDLCLGSIFSSETNNQEIDKRRSREGTLLKRHIKQKLRSAVFSGFQGNNALNKQEWGFLKGEWLEVFLAGLLKKHASSLDIGEVRLGLEIKSIVTETETEFDVVFMKNYTLHVMECKCGTIRNIKPEAHMDRLAARSKQLGALRVVPYFATNSPVLQDERGFPREAVQQRAELYKICLLFLKELHALGAEEITEEEIKKILKL